MNEINMIEQIYRTAGWPIQQLPQLFSDLNLWHRRYPRHNYLQPCVIGQKAALVCQSQLSLNAPVAYAALQALAERYGIYLKEDSRQHDSLHGLENRRANVAVLLTFCLSMLGTSRLVTAHEISNAAASDTVMVHLSKPIHTMDGQTMVNKDGHPVISLKHAALPTAAQVLASYGEKKSSLHVDVLAEAEIQKFLQITYQPAQGDPASITNDMAAMAKYYAQYPPAIALIKSLSGKNLHLKYKPDSWQTQAWGSDTQVQQVTVFFDPRLAAHFVAGADCNTNPACNIAPADALLHELLHAKLMLVDEQHFVESGGLKPTIYPYEHEREVISNENRLYQAMNQQDGLARPLRTRHAGALFHVQCALCMVVGESVL